MRRFWVAFWAEESGQALSEYAVIVAAFLVGAAAVGGFLLPRFIYAWNVYHESFYTVLNLPFP